MKYITFAKILDDAIIRDRHVATLKRICCEVHNLGVSTGYTLFTLE